MSPKEFITNRLGLKICVIVESVSECKGVAVLMHGLGDNKDLPYLVAISQALNDLGFTVVRFDATHSSGESDGDFAQALVSGYYSDLEDVINWTTKKISGGTPLLLCGHSLGAYSVAKYAQAYPDLVLALILISPIVSGSLESPYYNIEMLANWKSLGYFESRSSKNPERVKRLDWSYYESRLEADLLNNANKITAPTLLMVGELDNLTPVIHQRRLYDSLICHKDLAVIAEAGHSFKDPTHINQVVGQINKFLLNLT